MYFVPYKKFQRACYRVWEINMGVCPRMEFHENMCIYCLGYDCYKNGVSSCKCNSNYDVKYDVTSIAEGTPLLTFL